MTQYLLLIRIHTYKIDIHDKCQIGIIFDEMYTKPYLTYLK